MDVPISGGNATSNDGNSARILFEEHEISLKSTNLNTDLTTRFYVILRTINCGLDLNHKKFHAYCKKTTVIYKNHNDWFYMPRSVHQILIHGSEIIANFCVPTGLFCEEAQEDLDKDYK